MRHGDAVFSGGDRVLSPKGMQEAHMTGVKLVSIMPITKVISSPKERAVQTATIVRELIKGRNIPKLEILNELSPNGDADSVRAYVEATCSEDDNVLLVSHIPQVVNLSYAFCPQCLKEVPMFYTAAALIVERDANSDKYQPISMFTPSGETHLNRLIATAQNAWQHAQVMGTGMSQDHDAYQATAPQSAATISRRSANLGNLFNDGSHGQRARASALM